MIRLKEIPYSDELEQPGLGYVGRVRLTIICTTCKTMKYWSIKAERERERQGVKTYTIRDTVLRVVVREVDDEKDDDSDRVEDARLDDDADRTAEPSAAYGVAREDGTLGTPLNGPDFVRDQSWRGQ